MLCLLQSVTADSRVMALAVSFRDSVTGKTVVKAEQLCTFLTGGELGMNDSHPSSAFQHYRRGNSFYIGRRDRGIFIGVVLILCSF